MAKEKESESASDAIKKLMASTGCGKSEATAILAESQAAKQSKPTSINAPTPSE